MTDVVELSLQTLDLELGRADAPPLLLDLWGPGCAPCERMAPLLKQLAGQYGQKLRVVKLDVSQAPELAKRLAVRAIPTLLLFRDGQEHARHLGFANLQELRHWLLSHDIEPPAGAPPETTDQGHGHGAFYGDAQLRDFLIERLCRLASQTTDQDREQYQWAGGWDSLSKALVQHEDPDVFERVTGMPAAMQGLLDLVGGGEPLTAEQVEPLLRSLAPGAALGSVPLQFLHDWLGDPAEDWPMVLADPVLDTLRIEWLEMMARSPRCTEVGMTQWTRLRDRLMALHTRHQEAPRLSQDGFIDLLAALCPPPPNFASFWRLGLRRSAGSVLMNQARLAAGWTHEDVGMQTVLHRWFSAREAQEPAGRFTPERLAAARQQWEREQAAYMAKYDAFQTGADALMRPRYAALRERLRRLLLALGPTS